MSRKEELKAIYLHKRIRINHLDNGEGGFDDSTYDGKEGVVTSVDDLPQLHGTWGGVGVDPFIDDIELID